MPWVAASRPDWSSRSVLAFDRTGLGGATRVAPIVGGLVASAVALGLAAVGWYRAAEVACGDTYECPF